MTGAIFDSLLSLTHAAARGGGVALLRSKNSKRRHAQAIDRATRVAFVALPGTMAGLSLEGRLSAAAAPHDTRLSDSALWVFT
jgi:hypothetical protein